MMERREMTGRARSMRERYPWATDSQLEAMAKEGNLIVSAAAGAGKTSVLTRRIAGLIREGTDIDRMLILTFTRAAAQEMRQRIERELKAMVETEEDPVHRTRLMSEADATGSAYISTIDSFCGRVLRRYGHRAGLPSTLRVGDEIELAVIAADVEDELLHRFGAEGNPDYARLLVALNGENAVWESILALNEFLEVRPYPEKWLENLAKTEQDPGYAENMLALHIEGQRFLLESALEGLKRCRDELDPRYTKVLGILDEDIMTMDGVLAHEDPDDFREALRAIEWQTMRFPNKTPDCDKAPAKAARDSLKKTVKKVLAKLPHTKAGEFALIGRGLPIEKALIRLTMLYREELKKEKLVRNVIGFSDAEHYALEILSDPEVAAEYRKQFEYIAVDEYQDSNELQEELLNRIKREDNLFLVGDVKQSIYRFRAAEPGLFLEKLLCDKVIRAIRGTEGFQQSEWFGLDMPWVEAVVGFIYKLVDAGEDRIDRFIHDLDIGNDVSTSEGKDKDDKEKKTFVKLAEAHKVFCGELINLNENFRSHPDILNAVNSIFYGIMTKRVGEMDYTPDVALKPGLANELPGGAELHLINKNCMEEEKDTDGAAEEAENRDTGADEPEGKPEDSVEEELANAANAVVEARFIAKRISELMATKGIDHGDGKGVTPYRYSDFAVLMRTGTEAENIAATLAQEGVPAFVQATGGFFDAVEVQVLLNLLRVIDNRRQDIPLASVLRSPIFAFTDEELARLRVNEPVGSFYEAFLAAAQREDIPAGEEQLYAKIRETEAYLESKRFESTLRGIAELVAGIIDETHYYEIVGAEREGAQRRRNLDALAEQAQKFENAGGSGIWRFVSAMDSTSHSSGGGVGAAQESAGDVVRIMTVHKSKGLEFPVVFLAETAKKFHGTDRVRPLNLHGECGIGLRFIEDSIRYETITYKAAAEKLRLEDLSEEMRVLYVALTRAKQRLIVIGTKSKPWDYIDRFALPVTCAKSQAAVCSLDWIVYGHKSAPKLWPVTVHDREEFLSASVREETDGTPVQARPEDVALFTERFAWRYPYENAVSLPAKQSVSRAVVLSAPAEEEPPLPKFEEPAFMSGKTEQGTAALRGTAVHLILRTMPKDAVSGADVRAHVDEMMQNGVIETEETDAIHMDDLTWFVGTPLFARLNTAETQRREWSFTRRTPAKACITGPEGVPADSDEPVLLQGVIDCCFTEDGAWVLLDYKTDRVRQGITAAAYAEKHRRQLELYADALTALTGKPVKEKLLVLLAWHEIVSL